MPHDRASIVDILNAIRRIDAYTSGITREEFESDGV